MFTAQLSPLPKYSLVTGTHECERLTQSRFAAAIGRRSNSVQFRSVRVRAMRCNANEALEFVGRVVLGLG